METCASLEGDLTPRNELDMINEWASKHRADWPILTELYTPDGQSLTKDVARSCGARSFDF